MKSTNFFLFISSAISAEASLIKRVPAAYQDYGELRIAIIEP
jgi:hypothetical protein